MTGGRAQAYAIWSKKRGYVARPGRGIFTHDVRLARIYLMAGTAQNYLEKAFRDPDEPDDDFYADLKVILVIMEGV